MSSEVDTPIKRASSPAPSRVVLPVDLGSLSASEVKTGRR
jgi:hypothetical protein